MSALIEFFKGFWVIYLDFLRVYISSGRVVLDYLHAFFDLIFHFLLYFAIIASLFYLLFAVVPFFYKKNFKEKGFDFKKAPFVTVQIPTMNELIALRCAERCLDFDYPKDRYEILIGDDSNKKEVSVKIAEFASAHKQVMVIKRNRNTGFKPGNLNNMLKYSKGDILVLFDSDFTPEKDFLKRIVAPFVNDKDVSAVQARWNFNNFNQNFVTVMASTIVYMFHYVMLSFMDVFGTTSLAGSAEAVRKKDLVELGAWKSGSLTEDIEYSLRLHKLNKKMVYLPELECYSDVPFKTIDLCKQQMRWAYGVISSTIEHFKGVMLSKVTPLRRKLLGLSVGFGYILPVLIFLLFISGALSLVTHRPEPLNLPKFFSEMSLNIVWTSGLLIASFISLYRSKKMKYSLKMLISSFSVGLVTTYYVNKGIFKAILKKPMHWYLLSKNNDYSS